MKLPTAVLAAAVLGIWLMPQGRQDQRRPADTVATAVRVATILTGEIEGDTGDSGKGKDAQSLGK